MLVLYYSQPSTPTHAVRTAKSERRLHQRQQRESSSSIGSYGGGTQNNRDSSSSIGVFDSSPERSSENQENQRELSSAEKRGMEADKRAAWRKAR